MKNYLKTLLKDIIPVLFGVLLALWINNLNEDRKDQAYIDNFYIALQQELGESNNEINIKKTLQQGLIDTLNVYLSNDTMSLYEVIGKADGVHVPLIRINYWKAISKSKIELLDYEKLSILSDIEEQNEIIKYKLNKLLDFIFANITDTDPQKKLIFKLMMEEIIRSQRDIQLDIQKVINVEKTLDNES